MPFRKLPQIKIWADEPLHFGKTKHFKGKFIVTQKGKFFAKLFPLKEYEGLKFYHNEILEEMGVKKADSPEVKKEVQGGGKIEVEFIKDYVEVRLYGASSIYGPYHPDEISTGEIEKLISVMFGLKDIPILVIPDLEG